MSRPPTSSPCSSFSVCPSRSSSGSCSPICTRAYVRAKTPSWITCAPMSVSATNPSIVWICHERPKTSTGPVASSEHSDDAEEEQCRARIEVEPARAVQQHEADVPPRVPEAVELRFADSRVVVDRDLADRESTAICLEDHLGRELHPCGVEVESGEGVLAHGAHAAVRVRHLDAEEEVQHPGEDRISDEAVEERHRIAVDRPLEPRADDEVVTLLEPVDERCQLLERVRLVRITHHDVVASCLGESREVCASVAASRLRDDPRAVRGRHVCRAVRRCVVDDDDLARPPRASNAVERLLDDPSDRLLLVEAGDDDGDLRCRSRHRRPTLAGVGVASPSVTVSRRAARVHHEGRRRPCPPRGRRTPTLRLALLADICRLNALVAVKRAGSGHLGSSFSALDVVVHLLYEELNVAELGFDHPDRDVFFSSKGHDVPGLYAALYGLGVLSADRLARLRRLGGLDGHPDVARARASRRTRGRSGWASRRGAASHGQSAAQDVAESSS